MKTVEELEKELEEERAKNAENIKALQRTISEKDLEAKKVQEEIATLKTKGTGNEVVNSQIEALTKTVEALTGQIGNLNTDKQKAELQSKYPDILPDLLIGKSAEEAEIIVNKQREITMQNYDQKPSAHAPIFKDRDSIDAEIQRVKDDKKMTTDEKFVAVRELKLKKEEI